MMENLLCGGEKKKKKELNRASCDCCSLLSDIDTFEQKSNLRSH